MNVPPKLQVEITALLQEVQQQGQFHHLILTDDSGMLVAAAGQADWEAETLAAMVGTVWRWVDRIHQRLGLAASDEVALRDTQGRRVVGRTFWVGEQRLTLILVATVRQPYRRITTQAIHRIRDYLEQRRRRRGGE